MSVVFGALYLDRSLEEVREGWRRRLERLDEPRLLLRCGTGRGSSVRVQIRPRRGRRVNHRRLGTLVRAALGPEREELAEFWLLQPGDAQPGPLRLAGAAWEACLESVARAGTRQVRLWSPMVCPGPARARIAGRARELGLAFQQAGGWTVMAERRPQQDPTRPEPWKGNYGW